MTLNGAIMELVMLSEHPMMPVIFKPSIQKIIETVSECEESERKTGRWIVIDDQYELDTCKCSECGVVEYFNQGWKRFDYCPNCGADMRGANDD